MTVASVVHLCVTMHISTLQPPPTHTRVVRARNASGVDKSVPGEGDAGGVVVAIILSFIHYCYYRHKT